MITALKIVRVTAKNFRGYRDVEVVPRGNVLLVGEPRAGRTDLLEAIGLALAVDPPRALAEFDFHERNLDAPIEIEVVLAELSGELVQRFVDNVEFWNPTDRTLLERAEDLTGLPPTAIPAVRLAFRGEWDEVEATVQQIRYWPKASDPTSTSYRRVSREDRAALPFSVLSGGRPLNLAPQGDFRGFLSESDPVGLADTLDELKAGMERLAADLAAAPVVSAGVTTVFDPLWSLVRVATANSDAVRLLPDGGGLAALLRSLMPAVDLADGAGHLPLHRHGSTTSALVGAAEAVATGAARQGVVMIDDFGDSLDTSGAERLSRKLRESVGQVWLSTRRPEVARAFEPDELVRLSISQVAPMTRRVSYGVEPGSRQERIAARELHRQVLPAMTARAVIVVEGPHDLSAYSALVDRLSSDPSAIPAANGARLIDAGGDNGGIDKVDRICALARQLGFRVVALVDFDNDMTVAAARLSKLTAAADYVVRLPHKSAIEHAVLDCTDAAIVAALVELNATFELPLLTGWQTLTGDPLKGAASKALKSNSGLHAEFVATLAPNDLPALATRALREAVACSCGLTAAPHVQL
jgi:putative ATP-dependent endonuclease of the OLD family